MSDQSRKYLMFSLSGSRYGLDLKYIAEVGDPPHLWPIPLSSPYYGGALNFHGDIVAALNLSLLMGLEHSSRPGKIIVLHKEIASLAFLVDAVDRIVSADELSAKTPSNGKFSTAQVVFGGGDAILLDLDKLVLEAEKSIHK